MAELKQIAQAKNLMSQILIQKRECYQIISVVALINVCTVKQAQLHSLIRFKSAWVIVCPAGVKSHHTQEKNVFYLDW